LNLTSGFDRTFGPSFVYLNKDGDLKSLFADAKSHASPIFAADFYDEVSYLIPGYANATERGTFNAKIRLPEGAGNAKAVLSETGRDFQDNVGDSRRYLSRLSWKVVADRAGSYQYWANFSSSGEVSIARVRAGSYRLTVYAEGESRVMRTATAEWSGVFGQYEQDNVTIAAGDGSRPALAVIWVAESHGTELFRLGTPDKVSPFLTSIKPWLIFLVRR
jgi:rhamnogalacturonan endolyase